jgi:hypothetical protein
MPLQSNVNALIRYGLETTLGTASAAAGKSIRRVSSTLALTKEAFSSNEVRPDQQVFDARHGVRRVAGAIQGELSTQTYDDWIEAVLRGTWAAGTTIQNTTPAMSSATVTATSGSLTGIFTASAGSYITAGLRVGDVFRITGSTGNTSKNFRIVSLTATVATVFPSPVTAASASTWTITVQGRKLAPGTTARSFTIEQHYPDIDVSEQFLGCRVGEMGVSLPPTGMATVSFGMQGTNAAFTSGAQAPTFAAPTAAPATNLLTAVGGSLSIAGTPSAIITGVDFSVTNNLNSTPVVGSNFVPDIFYGRMVIQGNLTAYFEDLTVLNYFLNETEVHMQIQLDDANGTDFLCFRMPRVKLMGGSKTVGPDGGVILQSPFQALLSSGVSGVDDGSLIIQRSNV